jgi:hypothetical protein
MAETVSALGLASKALAVEAAAHAGGNEQEFVEMAAKRFAESMAQRVEVQVLVMLLH